ncbi:hypothetical protein G6M85_21195 [Agrobacterium tumefaciens]|jgi:phage major head subunit gpT-like protein|uniref:hypothetical protein n=1 Tax=Agrobacterium tumefaciens TaxID=358 RepID=UPI00157248C2|nr:hypothetical protein [Agrobacterium tumefaciens]NTE68123.1 hypothetical protein [Agrobacterium tumefaciens]
MSSIQKAAAATAEIDGHVFTALEALRGFDGRIANGYGVYSDPSNLRRDLVEARKAIESALSVMQATTWPTEAQYEKAEQA